MKAAVLHQLGSTPKYENIPDPVPQNKEQILLTVKAASIKNIDKLRAAGTHYASYTQLPAIVGIDGVGVLADGTRVYAQGITGMIAEKALIDKNRYTVLPDKTDDLTAAALPNAVIGAAMPLRYRAKLKKGDTVLINGATGFTGQLAVQIAKYYGASKVITTGRNPDSLHKLIQLGSDAVISLNRDDETIIKKLKEIHSNTPVDIVIDYLWGHSLELILTAFKGSGINRFSHPVQIVTVGSMSDENISLGSGILRSSAIEVLGSGIGSISPEAMEKYRIEVLPEMMQLSAEGKLTIETETAELKNIETAWHQKVPPGKRLVVRI